MMSDRDKYDPEALLMEVHAAKFLSLSVRTLQAWRLRGDGPAYVRAGRAIRYRRSDLVAWINENTVAQQNCSGQNR
jgi:predicted DNA-binding transcriptional regulator AlpA